EVYPTVPGPSGCREPALTQAPRAIRRDERRRFHTPRASRKSPPEAIGGFCRPRLQRPVNRGGRFSRSAASASRWSALLNVTISRAVGGSNATLSAPLASLLTASWV